MWPDLGKPTFWAHLPSGIKTTVSPNKKELIPQTLQQESLIVALSKCAIQIGIEKSIW